MRANAAVEPDTAPFISTIGFETLEGGRRGAVRLHVRARRSIDDSLASVRSRALTYLRAGAPIHFRGPAGTGKTTLAMSVAAALGRPVMRLVGDSWTIRANPLGQQAGVTTPQVVHRSVSCIRTVEREAEAGWSDNALITAITNGYTLIYDEFTRSPPQSNTPLLMALEDRMIVVPSRGHGDRFAMTHPDFRAILTSNTEDYAGITPPQDSLTGRLITFDVDYQSRAVEIGIVQARTGAEPGLAAAAVDIVRCVRESPHVLQRPSVRSAITIARVARNEGFDVDAADARFVQLCLDVLEAKATNSSIDPEHRSAFQLELSRTIRAVCGAGPVEGEAECVQ